jgi:APA family basic amino acid/polyamine antiporter
VRGVIGGMVAALLPVFFSYGGWQMICYVAPEVDRPERTLPRAILIGVLGVVALYLLANAAFLHVLGLEGVAAHGDFAARLAERTAGPLGRRLLAAGMGISALGICAVIVIATPWLYVAMARERLFFAGFGRLHPRTGAPVLALLVQAAVALLYLVFGTLQSLVDSVVFVEWIFHGLVALALILLRVRRPDLPRPYASPLFPLAPAIYLLAALLVVGGSLWQAERRPVVTGLAIVALGALLYVPWRRLLARVERKRGVDLP